MSTPSQDVDTVLQALIVAATDATRASTGWVLALVGERLRVVAAAGEEPGALLGIEVPAGLGSAGFVVGSGQPLALSSADERLAEGIPALAGMRPGSVLCVPCLSDDTVVGALEVVDKLGGAAFSFDDVEIVTMLSAVCGPALVRADLDGRPHVASPEMLGTELARLAASDPSRYAALATVVTALLGGD